MKKATLRQGTAGDHAGVQVVNLAAFAQVHESLALILGTEINALVYPDWRASQQREVSELLTRSDTFLTVAIVENQVVECCC